MANSKDLELALRINANATQAKKELGSTEKALDGLKDQAKQAYGALAAAISTAGLSLWIASSLEAASNLELLARRSNATIEEFQRLAVGARMVGVEGEALAQIFQDVQEKLGDFTDTDGGELGDFFKGIAPQVGVTVEQFKKLNGPDALQLFVSNLEKAGVSQQRMVFFLESMASDASLLLPMLRNNGAGFKAWADEAERLGLILSTKTVRAISDYKAQTELTSIATENLGTKIGAEMIPALSSLNGLILEFVTDQEAAKEMADFLAAGLNLLATAALGVGGVFSTIGKLIGGNVAAIVQAVDGDFKGALQTFASVGTDVFSDVSKSVDRIQKLWEGGYSEAGKKAAELNDQTRAAQDKANASTEKAATLTAFQRQEIPKLTEKRQDDINKQKEISKVEEARIELQRLKIPLDSEQAKKYLELAAAEEKAENAAEAKKKSEQDAASAAADRKRQAEQAAQQEASYIDNLRRQAETLGMTAEQMRAYDLAQQKMTLGGRQLSQTYLDVISAFEQQQQALENADTNAGLEADYLTAIGRETDAALLEISTKYNRLQRDFEKTGNETGKVWAKKLIDVERVKARLDAVQSEMDKSQSAISRAENRINIEREAGLLTQTEAQQKLLALRAEEIKLIEGQLPTLRDLAAQGGAAGEQAQIQLDGYQTRLIELKNTATDLQRAFKEGLTSGLNEAINGLADGTMDLRDAISALVLSVAQSLQQLASQQLADQLWSSVSSVFNSGSPAADATDATGAVAYSTAIDASSAIGAGLMGDAIMAAGAEAAAAIAAAIKGSSVASGGSSAITGEATNGLFSGIADWWEGLTFADGGHVSGPGTGTSDSIPAWLSNGEFVTRAAVTQQPGAQAFLQDFNERGMAALDRYRHATGGLAGIPAPSMPAPTLGSMQLAEPAKAQGATVKNAINLYAVQDESAIASMAWGRAGQEHYKIYLQRNASEIRSILKI